MPTLTPVKLKLGNTAEEVAGRFPIPDWKPPKGNANARYRWWYERSTLWVRSPELADTCKAMETEFRRGACGEPLASLLLDHAKRIAEADARYRDDRSTALFSFAPFVKTTKAERQEVYRSYSHTYSSQTAPWLYAAGWLLPKIEFLKEHGINCEIKEDDPYGNGRRYAEYALHADCEPYILDAIERMKLADPFNYINVWRKHAVNFRVYWPTFDPKVLPFD